MNIQRTNVSRESIQFSPGSNIELNAERLPRPEEMEGMELRFRVEPTGTWTERPWPILAIGLLLAQVYAAGWWAAPAIVRWLWNEAHSIEGMPVVGGMLAGLLLLMVLLSLVLVPRSIRVGLATLTLPMAAITALSCLGQASVGLAVAFVGLLGGVLWWRSSLLRFHHSWLSADPRMTTAEGKKWLGRRIRGWRWPRPSAAVQVLCRYLDYDVPLGVPGVWIAPSPCQVRASSSGLIIGTILAVAHSVAGSGLGTLLSGAALLAISAWILGETAWLTRKCEEGLKPDDRNVFEQYSDRLRNSNHVARDPVTGEPIKEAEHLLLGIEPGVGIPILLHQPLLHEHAHVDGRTGSGKTSMALMSMMIQLIRGHRATSAKWSQPSPVIVVDLKGDEILFQTARAEAEARGQVFRFFTLERLRATFCLNAFVCFKSLSITPPQLVQIILDALGLFYGFTYGRSHFSEGSRMMLAEALRNADGVNCGFHRR